MFLLSRDTNSRISHNSNEGDIWGAFSVCLISNFAGSKLSRELVNGLNAKPTPLLIGYMIVMEMFGISHILMSLTKLSYIGYRNYQHNIYCILYMPTTYATPVSFER